MGHSRTLIAVSIILFAFITTTAHSTRFGFLPEKVDNCCHVVGMTVPFSDYQLSALSVDSEPEIAGAYQVIAEAVTEVEIGWEKIPTPHVWFGDKRGCYALRSGFEEHRILINGGGRDMGARPGLTASADLMISEIHREGRRAAYG